MSWVRIDDGFWAHPKVMVAGNEAAGIFCRCLSYCGAYLTDGLIPEPIALQIAGNKRSLEMTVDCGLLTRLDSGSVYISDYADYNPLRDQVEAARKSRSERGAKGAHVRWGNGNGDG